MAIITKTANWATIHLRFAKLQMRCQTRHVDNWEFYEKDNFGKNFLKGLVKIETRWWNRHVDNCGFYKKDKCCKIREFGKDSSKVWENCLLVISENSNFGGNGEFGKNLSKVWQN